MNLNFLLTTDFTLNATYCMSQDKFPHRSRNGSRCLHLKSPLFIVQFRYLNIYTLFIQRQKYVLFTNICEIMSLLFIYFIMSHPFLRPGLENLKIVHIGLITIMFKLEICG